jgi:hypothetical protein
LNHLNKLDELFLRLVLVFAEVVELDDLLLDALRILIYYDVAAKLLSVFDLIHLYKNITTIKRSLRK